MNSIVTAKDGYYIGNTKIETGMPISVCSRIATVEAYSYQKRVDYGHGDTGYLTQHVLTLKVDISGVRYVVDPICYDQPIFYLHAEG